MSDVKPCPHCGESRAFVEDIDTAQGLKWYVFCYACGAAGGYKVTPAKAIEAWNTRAERTTTRNGKYRTRYGRKVPLCECCGYAIGDDRYNYCPKCGARVKGNDDE